MTRDSLIEKIHDRTDVRRTFREIHEAVEEAASQEDLTELYKQTVYMILMTHSSPLNEKDREMKRRREIVEREFSRIVRTINRRAKKFGLRAGYSEDWESLATNAYETGDENLLEAHNNANIIHK